MRECFIHVRNTVSDFKEVQQYIKANRFLVGDYLILHFLRFLRIGERWHCSGFAGIGIYRVHEASESVPLVEEAVKSIAHQEGILPNCPAVVNYVEQYFPKLVSKLLPVASPMIVHGRMLRKEYGKSAIIVHICPCSAKVYEAHRPENAGAIDCVITFQELMAWIAHERIDMAALEEVPFDCAASLSGEKAQRARMISMKGGLLHSCGYSWNPCETESYSVSGTQDVKDILTEMSGGKVSGIVEPLFCHGGCCNGPNFPNRGDTFVSRRAAVLRYAKTAPALKALKETTNVAAHADYEQRPYVPERQISEMEIAAILKKQNVSGQQITAVRAATKPAASVPLLF